ncbi:TonB-dependent receptor, partial [Aeromonas simiae]
PDHDQIDPAVLGFNYQDDEAIRQRQTGLYLQDQVRWDRWVLIAGGRYDTYRSDTDSRTLYQGAPGQSHGRISQHNTSWRVGALYELPSGLAPYLNYAESFEPVAGIDKNGNGFKPSTGQQWEGGVKYLSADGGASATLSAFHITKKNSLVTDPDNLYGPKLQTGETVSRGIELEGRRALSDALDVSASYTLLDMEITRDTAGLKGKTPVWVPEQTASLWADYRIEQGSLSGLTLGSGVRYVGKTEIDAQNSGKVPGYTLWDMAARYDLGRLGLRGTEAVLSASNLLDKAYLSCYDTGNCWFGAERNIEARLNYRF